MKKKIVWLSLIALFGLSACSLSNEKSDPFAEISQEKVETIFGEVFPFSVSVSTQATHRIENDNKLVSLIASDIVQLEEFEGRIVELDGVYRKEKMRPIFWVKSIRVKDADENSAKKSNRFKTNTYSFVVPENWESSILEDGTVHFLDKKDPQRKIFLTFAKKTIEETDTITDPNIVIANMAGNQTNTEFDSGQVRQEISLFSNISERDKYVFVFNNNSADFSRKKDFFTLLNSFIEGAENVRIAHEEELKKLAQAELELVKKMNEATAAAQSESETAEENTEENEGASENLSIVERIFGAKDNPEDAEENPTEIISQEITPDVIVSDEFENKIDDRAFYYESQFLGFNMSVPYGLWFRNLGKSNDFIGQIGFANREVNSAADAQFFLNIIADENPVTEFQEIQKSGKVVIQFPRNNISYFELNGSVLNRDYMRSIQTTIATF